MTISGRTAAGSKRIGILTFHFSNNVGALLQAYALRAYLQRIGHDVEFINFVPNHVEGLSFRQLRTLPGFLKSAGRYFLETARLISDPKLRGVRLKNAHFRQSVLGVTTPAIRRLNRSDRLPKLDVVICGSDQIWNFSQSYGFEPAYFGCFEALEGVRRVSYAASFGRPTLPRGAEKHLARLLSGLSEVGVREESGRRLVESAGRNATVVPDPTVLLGATDMLPIVAKDVAGESPHIFAYALREHDGVAQVSSAVGRFHNAAVYVPDSPSRRWPAFGTSIYTSPGEWLAWLAGAKFVVTNSFHGVVLSALFEKEFLSVGLRSERGVYSDRIRHFLLSVGLMSRYVESTDVSSFDPASIKPVDWGLVRPRLEKMRADGIDFLVRALNPLA